MGIALIFTQSLVIESWEDFRKAIRRLNVPETLKFVTISFPMSWFFAIIAEAIRVWFYLGSFIC